jgi:hypothetical protein
MVTEFATARGSVIPGAAIVLLLFAQEQKGEG